MKSIPPVGSLAGLGRKFINQLRMLSGTITAKMMQLFDSPSSLFVFAACPKTARLVGSVTVCFMICLMICFIRPTLSSSALDIRVECWFSLKILHLTPQTLCWVCEMNCDFQLAVRWATSIPSMFLVSKFLGLWIWELLRNSWRWSSKLFDSSVVYF